MKRIRLYAAVIVVLSMLPATGPAQSRGGADDLPRIGGKPTLALINGEALTLEEFERALAGIHGGLADNVSRSMSKPSLLLDRLINARLILQEARNIGLHELPEIDMARKTFEEETLRAMVHSHLVRDIRSADPKEVEKRYREEIKEVKVASVLFEKEEDAKRMKQAVKNASAFGEAAGKAIAAGGAKGSPKAQFMRFASLSPEVAKAVSAMKKGDVSPVMKIGSKFSLLRLEAVRYPENRAVRQRVEEELLKAKRQAALLKRLEGLRKKYATMDRKVLSSLDYDSADKGSEKLRGDGRVVASLKGGVPVTVGELTAAIEKKFFHGMERAVERKKVNSIKEPALEEILNRRVALIEAERMKLREKEYFKARVQENRDALLFGMFVRKVIAPEVKVGERDVKDYYESHGKEYTYPEMARIDGILFSSRKAADDAIGKLRKGADFQWLRANAEGQPDAEAAKDLPSFRGDPVLVGSLSDGIGKAIAGASPGDYRLYAHSDKAFYVLNLKERVPSRPIPLESVKADVEKKAFADKVRRVLRDWEGKLRKASDIKIYASGKKLDDIVKPGAMLRFRR